MATAQAEEVVDHPLEATTAWLSDVAGDPVAFVEGVFPWGEGELANFDGPMEWQQWVLEQIRDGLLMPGRQGAGDFHGSHATGEAEAMPSHPLAVKSVTAAGEKLGVGLHMMPVRNAEDFDRVFAEKVEERVEGFLDIASPLTVARRTALAELALKHRLAGIFGLKIYVEAGGSHELWGRLQRSSSPRGGLHRQNSQKCQPGRSAGGAGVQI